MGHVFQEIKREDNDVFQNRQESHHQVVKIHEAKIPEHAFGLNTVINNVVNS